MTPTADDRGGSLCGTRREAGFLLPMEERRRQWASGNGDFDERLELHATITTMTKRPKPSFVDFERLHGAGHRSRSVNTRDHPRFYSILFASREDRIADDGAQAPEFFRDLNCDQIVDAITAGRDEYRLKPFFYACLRRVEAIEYRHEVMRDLESTSLYGSLNSFASTMREVREHLDHAKKAYYKEQKRVWFLDAVVAYCDNITSFATQLATSDLRSRGFLAFRDFLVDYSRSTRFTSFFSSAQKLKADLASVEYCVLIKGSSFTVRKYEGEADYSAEVEYTFEKFKQGVVRDYRVSFPVSTDMNHVEAKILEFVAKLHPEVFGALDEFCDTKADFLDPTIAVFDREVQFYAACLEYCAVQRHAGLAFCYPRVSDKSHEVYDYGGFDIALARKLLSQNSAVVCNDFLLKGRERILVVSGPNQGGKTTFARAFGQLHYLASIGCPVPGREAQLFLFDQLFTHFEKEERVETLRGKLEDDLVRIANILGKATPRSIIIMNEIFTSTTIQDEIFLSERIMQKLLELDLLCVWVTFVDELASFSTQTVSMASTVDPDDPAVRTFKILRRPADGLAYAMAIAHKYRLTYESIRERIKP
jgi:DNA mismatch repair protein MutS